MFWMSLCIRGAFTANDENRRGEDFSGPFHGHPCEKQSSVRSYRQVIVKSTSDHEWRGGRKHLSMLHFYRGSWGANFVKWRLSFVLGGEIKLGGIRCPDEASDPVVKILREIFLLPRLAVVQHQPEAIALVSRTLLGAVGDVLAIGRIERRRVAGGIVGGDVLRLDGRDARRSIIHRDDPQIVFGGRRPALVGIRGVANLLPVGRESVVVLPAERELRSIVVAGREIAGCARWTAGGGCPYAGIGRNHENVAALAGLVRVPVAIQQAVKDERLDFRILGFFQLPGVAVGLCGGRAVAFGIDIGGKENVLAIGRPEFATGFGGDG